jgi:hypothetical protein
MKPHFNISLNSKVSMQLSMLVILFVGLAVGPTLSYATNEGSYKYGFNNAVSDYETCYQGWTGTEGCNIGSDEPISECYVGAGPGNVTNSTACFDGYMNGWKHWCRENAKDCVGLTTADIFPGSLSSDNKTGLTGLKTLSYIVGTWNFVNETRNGLLTSGVLALEGDNGQTFIQIVDGRIVHSGNTDSSGGWYSNGHLFELSYHNGPGLWMKFTAVSPERMTLVDVKGDIIHLVNNEIKPLMTSKLVGTWNFVRSNSNETVTGKLTLGPEGNNPIPDTANFTETPFYEHFKNGTTYGLPIAANQLTGTWFTNGYTLTLRHETDHPFSIIFDVLIPKSIDSNRNHLIFSDQNGGIVDLTARR